MSLELSSKPGKWSLHIQEEPVYTKTEYSDFNDFHINISGWIVIHHVIKALITLP